MSARNLRVSPELALPVDAVTQTFVVFGKKGSGKTNTAVVLAEEMFPLAPFAVLDPIGAWWGLKASFDGQGPGLQVYVFGGKHGDLPLDPAAGQLMADVLIEHVRILEALIGAYPDPIERTELAERAGASPTSSAYANNLGRLRTLGLIDYPDRGHVVALPVLFLESR